MPIVKGIANKIILISNALQLATDNMKTNQVIIVSAIIAIIFGLLMMSISSPRSQIAASQELWIETFDSYLKGIINRSEYVRVRDLYLEIEKSRPYSSTGRISILLGSAFFVVSLLFSWLSNKIEEVNLTV